MQAGLRWNTKTVEFVRPNDEHRVAVTRSLLLTCGCEADDPVEPYFGFPRLPAGKLHSPCVA